MISRRPARGVRAWCGPAPRAGGEVGPPARGPRGDPGSLTERPQRGVGGRCPCTSRARRCQYLGRTWHEVCVETPKRFVLLASFTLCTLHYYYTTLLIVLLIVVVVAPKNEKKKKSFFSPVANQTNTAPTTKMIPQIYVRTYSENNPALVHSSRLPPKLARSSEKKDVRQAAPRRALCVVPPQGMRQRSISPPTTLVPAQRPKYDPPRIPLARSILECYSILASHWLNPMNSKRAWHGQMLFITAEVPYGWR